MATLDQLRSLFPDAESDSDVIRAAAQRYGIDEREIASELGVKINAPGMWTSVKRGAGQVAESTGSALRDVGLDRAGRAIESYGEDVAYRNPAAVNSVSDAISSPWQTVKEAVGEVVPQVGVAGATAIGGRLVGGALGLPFGPGGVAVGQNLGAAAGAYAGNLLQEYGSIRKEQREAGIDDRGRALGAAGGAAALDTALGVERAVTKVVGKGFDILAREGGTSLLKHVGKQAAFGVATESPTEVAQTALERYGAYKELTGDEALNEYGLAGIKGGIGGGVVRGGIASVAGTREPVNTGGEISQAFTQPNISGTPTSTLPSVAPVEQAPAAQPAPAPGALGEAAPAPTIPQPPVVTGGTSEIAQATQAAQAENAMADQKLQQQAAREQAFEAFGIAAPEDQTRGTLFGQPLFGPKVAEVGDAVASLTAGLDPVKIDLAKAVAQAHSDTGNQLVKFAWNANNVPKSVQGAFDSIAKVLDKFQIAHVKAVEEAAEILNSLSEKAKGQQLEQIDAIHRALTGESTIGFEAAQGAGNGKLQVQNASGLGAVRKQGGAGQTAGAVAGDVRPGGVQPVDAGSVPEGSLGLQVGQPAADGVRPGPGVAADASGSAGVAPAPQVTEAQNGSPQRQEAPVAVQSSAEQPVQAAVPAGAQERVDQDAAVPRVRLEGAEELDPEQAADIAEELIHDALEIVIPVKGRSTPENARKRREFLLTRLTNGAWASLTQMAEDVGVTVSTLTNWNTEAARIEESGGGEFFQKLAAAVTTLAQERNVPLGSVMAAISEKASRGPTTQTGEELVSEFDQTGQGTSRVSDGPMESDERQLRVQPDEELSAREVADEGLVTSSRKSASVQEQFNAVETNQAKYLALIKKLEDAENRGDDAEVDRLNAELEKVLEQAAKQDQQNKRRVRAKAGVDPDTGGRDAVQKRSTAQVDARQRASDGEAVGEGNAEQASGSEKAAKAWDETASEYPEAPKWADLTDEQRQDFIDYGEENWTPDDVRTELIKLAKTRFAQAYDMGDFDPSLTGIRMVRVDLDELEDTDFAVADALAKVRDAGLSYLVRRVDSWFVANAGKAFGAAFTHVGGKPAIVLNRQSLNDDNAAHFISHELGHLADTAFYTNADHVFSGVSLFGVLRGADGSVSATGSVTREVLEYYNSNPDSPFARTLRYPIERKQMGRMETQSELFAQLWAIWSSPVGREFLRAELPMTATFMETAYEVTKAQQAGAEAGISDTSRRREAVRSVEETSTRLYGPSGPGAVQVRFGQGIAFDGKALERLPEPLKRPVDTVWTKLFRNAALPLALTEDVVKMASKYMRSANDYLKAQYARQATRLRIEARVEKILQQFDKLPAEVQKKVNEYIYDSTMQQKWGYYPGEHRIGTTLFEVDPDMEARFKALPANAQVIVRDVFEHGYQMLRMKQQAVNAAIDREFADRERAAAGDQDTLDELAKEKKLLKARENRLRGIEVDKPYAYLARYGDHIVVAKSKEFKHYEERAKLNDFDAQEAKNWLRDNVSNPDHYVVQFAETQGEADKIAAGLIASGKFDMDGTEAGPKEHEHSFAGGDAFMAVKRLRTMAERGGEISEELQKALSNLYLATVAESSARKSELQRKNVAGADKNMMRNLATSGRADAHFLSAITHNDDVVDALEAMRKEAAGNRRSAMPIYNELYARYAKGMDYSPQGELSRQLTQFSTMFYLSTSPAFYLQQVLQTAVLSLPFMAGRLGYFRSVRAIRGAYDDVLKLTKGLGVNDHVDFSRAPADVRGMLETLVGMGKIDIGIDADAKARAGEHSTMDKVMHKLQGVNSRVETINRATAAIAAYRGYLQRYGGDKVAQATQYASDVVSNTHGSYDGFNTPRLLSSDIGRVIGQFKRFQIIQLSMLTKLIHTAFKGASKEEKAIARSSLRFILAHMAVLGGALGVPFVSQLGNILLGVFGDDDEPKDLEQTLRRAIGDDSVADLLLRGVPGAVGLESLGKKVAMENVASPLPFADPDFTSRSGMEKMIVAALGPTVNLSLKAADALGLMGKGDYYKGLEQLMPTGVANAMKGYRFGDEGVTMRNGDTVMGAEDIALVDATFQALGLPTNTLTDRQRMQTLVAKSDQFYQDRAAELKQSYSKAYRKGDAEGMQEAREAWAELQEARARNGYSRQPMSSLFRAPMEQAKRERTAIGGVETNRGNRRFVESLAQ